MWLSTKSPNLGPVFQSSKQSLNPIDYIFNYSANLYLFDIALI